MPLFDEYGVLNREGTALYREIYRALEPFVRVPDRNVTEVCVLMTEAATDLANNEAYRRQSVARRAVEQRNITLNSQINNLFNTATSDGGFVSNWISVPLTVTANGAPTVTEQPADDAEDVTND